MKVFKKIKYMFLGIRLRSMIMALGDIAKVGD
jgi:hypothetical protein